MVIDAPAGPFTMTAKADRIDLLTDGGIEILDYKTGGVPTKKDVVAGLSPQLALEALIVEAGGFEGVPAAAVSAIRYLKLTGGDPPGEEFRAHDDPATAVEDIRDGVAQLIATYDEPAQQYLPRPDPEIAPRYSDYDHLARLTKGSGRGDRT